MTQSGQFQLLNLHQRQSTKPEIPLKPSKWHTLVALLDSTRAQQINGSNQCDCDTGRKESTGAFYTNKTWHVIKTILVKKKPAKYQTRGKMIAQNIVSIVTCIKK